MHTNHHWYSLSKGIFGTAVPITVALAPLEEPLRIFSLLVGIGVGVFTMYDFYRKWKRDEKNHRNGEKED